ncbi:uncharacterized protein LOC141593114 [Silene latifolia]|uniref:uncharacterized protein LOC141593114 n=1 Tax=Silene latifolia TaxID=37657 RepID=UPI003D773577
METKKIIPSDLLHSYRLSNDIWYNVIEPNLNDDQKEKASKKITFAINAVNGETGNVLNLSVGHTCDKKNSLRRTLSGWINFGSTLKVGDYLRFSWVENNLHILRVSATEVESAAAAAATSTTNQATTKVKVSPEECPLSPKKMWLQRWYRQQGLKYYSGTGGDKRKEIGQLQNKETEMKKAAAKGSKAEQKAKKKHVEEEVAKLSAKLKEKHAQELYFT